MTIDWLLVSTIVGVLIIANGLLLWARLRHVSDADTLE